MELFDKIGDTIVSVSKDATQKAKDISELARIRMELRAKQDYLNKLFLEIGKIYYEAHQDDEEKEFKEQMLLVKDAQEVIEELKQQLGQIKGMVACVECGQEMPIDACYCSSCGAKLVKPKKKRLRTFLKKRTQPQRKVRITRQQKRLMYSQQKPSRKQKLLQKKQKL